MAATSLAYTQDERAETLQRVFQRIEDGELVEDACTAEGISGRSLRNWLREMPELLPEYTRVRSEASHAIAEEAVRIAVHGRGDAQERRLQYDALRWLAGKRRPKEYGDKVEHEVSGTVGHLHLEALRAPSLSARATLALPQLPQAPVSGPNSDSDALAVRPGNDEAPLPL